MHIHLLALAPKNMEVRTYLPLRELSHINGITVSSTEQFEFPDIAVNLPKVAILQRAYISSTAAWIPIARDLIKKGWILITEIDDHPTLMKKNKSSILTIERAFWGVHAVQTSTEILATELRLHNSEVAVFRNSAFSISPVNEPGSPVRVFFGALNRHSYSSQIGAALASLKGFDFNVVHDKAFFDALGAASKKFSPALPYSDYLAEMKSCNVVLAPLEGAIGEQYKSDLKFIEAASVGAAIIASPTVYGLTVDHNNTGLLADHPEEWRQALQRFADQTEFSRQLAMAAQRYIRKERMFSDQAPSRIAWYERLWSRRVELTATLAKRLLENLKRGI